MEIENKTIQSSLLWLSEADAIPSGEVEGSAMHPALLLLFVLQSLQNCIN